MSITEEQHREITSVGKAQVAVKAMEMVSFPDKDFSKEWLELTLKANSLMLRAWDNTDRLIVSNITPTSEDNTMTHDADRELLEMAAKVKRMTLCKHGLDPRSHGFAEVSEAGEYVLADEVFCIFRKIGREHIAETIERYSLGRSDMTPVFYRADDGKNMRFDRFIGEINKIIAPNTHPTHQGDL